jgi:hypothetical protein
MKNNENKPESSGDDCDPPRLVQSSENLADRLRADGVRVEAIHFSTDLYVYLPDGSKGASVLNVIKNTVGPYGFQVFESEDPADSGAIIARVNFANVEAWERIRQGGTA